MKYGNKSNVLSTKVNYVTFKSFAHPLKKKKEIYGF